MKKLAAWSIIFLIFFTTQAGVSLDCIVHTLSGPQKLGELCVGDTVVCCDADFVPKLSKVTAIQDSIEEVFEVIFDDDNYLPSELCASGEQRFFVSHANEWVAARDLEPGFCLLQQNGCALEVVSVCKKSNKQAVRSITVATHHNFFIGKQGVLAHNFVITIPILTWGAGVAMTWFEGVTLAGVVTTVGAVVAKKALAKGVKKATGKDISTALDVGEKVCLGTVHALQKDQPQPSRVNQANQANTIEVITAYDAQLPESTSCATCPGREVSVPTAIIQPGPEIWSPQRLVTEGYNIVPPAILVNPGREIMQPEKGSTITGIEPAPVYNRPIIFTKTIQDILDESDPWKKTGRTAQFVNSGGYEDALKDFYNLGPNNIIDMGDGFIRGILPDGRHINIRPAGSNDVKKTGGGLPTLEIQKNSDNPQAIKIRYTKDKQE